MIDQFEAVVAGIIAKTQREVTAEKKRIAHRCRRMREQILAPSTATEIQAAQNIMIRAILDHFDSVISPPFVLKPDGTFERMTWKQKSPVT